MTNKLTLSLLTLAACLGFSLDVARASTASQILNLTGGKRTKIVWERDMTGGGARYALDAAHSSKLVGHDTQDDTIRVILDAQARPAGEERHLTGTYRMDKMLVVPYPAYPVDPC